MVTYVMSMLDIDENGFVNETEFINNWPTLAAEWFSPIEILDDDSSPSSTSPSSLHGHHNNKTNNRKGQWMTILSIVFAVLTLATFIFVLTQEPKSKPALARQRGKF
jgi:hypothetical protein